MSRIGLLSRQGTELENVAGDAFILLINVFNNETVDIVSEKFMHKLTTAMEHINDESTLNALISILVIMCAAYEKKLQKENIYKTLQTGIAQQFSSDEKVKEEKA